MVSNTVANADTGVSNIVANARTRMFGPVRKRNRIVKRSGIGWTANGAGCVATRAGLVLGEARGELHSSERPDRSPGGSAAEHG